MTSVDPGPLYGLDPARLELVLRRVEQDRSPTGQGPPELGHDVPLSLGQERLWLAEQLTPGKAHYNISFPLRLRGELDVPALSAALDRITARHPALRTTMPVRAGLPHGRVVDARPGVLTETDLRHLDEAAREGQVTRRVAEHARTQFDLESGPLLRLDLLRLADDDAVLLATVHHGAADNFSMSVFFRELDAFYTDPRRTLPSPPPYSTFAARQRAELARTLGSQASYWSRQLDGLPAAMDLPIDRPRPDEQSFRGDRVDFAQPAVDLPTFRRVLADHDVTPFMVMIAALAVILQRYTGQDDLAIGTDVANRDAVEDEDVIGFFANQLVLRVRLDDNPSVADVLRQVRTLCLQAYAHQDLPFQQLVSMLGRDRVRDRSPVFQVKLGFLHFTADDLRLGAITVMPVPTTGTAKFDLEFTCWSGQDGTVGGFLEYSTDLFLPATARQMADHLVDALTAITRDTTAAVLDLPLRGGSTTTPAHTTLAGTTAEVFDFE
jgi:hypothetical protein